MSMKNSNENIGNRTRDLPACSVVITDLSLPASSSSSVGPTARCGLWPVEKYLSIFPYLSTTLSIFSLPALEDLFLLLLSILS
jgi:hypothetical protein